jgi:hypothetical protein
MQRSLELATSARVVQAAREEKEDQTVDAIAVQLQCF